MRRTTYSSSTSPLLMGLDSQGGGAFQGLIYQKFVNRRSRWNPCATKKCPQCANKRPHRWNMCFQMPACAHWYYKSCYETWHVIYTYSIFNKMESLHRVSGVSGEETSGCGLSNRNAGGSVALWGSVVTDNVLRHLCTLETSQCHAV